MPRKPIIIRRKRSRERSDTSHRAKDCSELRFLAPCLLFFFL